MPFTHAPPATSKHTPKAPAAEPKRTPTLPAQGYQAQSTAQGYQAQCSTQGYPTQSAVQGFQAQSAAQGYQAQSAAQGYQAQSKAQGYQAQSAALSPRRQKACLAAGQAHGRAEWLVERDPMQRLGQGTMVGDLGSVRDAVCNGQVPVSDANAERWVEAASAPITARERSYERAEAAERKAVDGPIAAAQCVRTGANVVGALAEAGLGPLGTGLGYARHMLGSAANEVYEGDGSFSAADAALQTLAWGTNELAGQAFTKGLMPSLATLSPVTGAVVAKAADLPRTELTGRLLNEGVTRLAPRKKR